MVRPLAIEIQISWNINVSLKETRNRKFTVGIKERNLEKHAACKEGRGREKRNWEGINRKLTN
jgi:hypothetical protein